MSDISKGSLRASLRETYDRVSREREAGETQGWKVLERANFLALLRSEHRHALLELGAGVGRDGKFFQDQGLEVTCTDLSPEMVALCRQKGLDAQVMDMGDLRFPDASFDAVYAMNSLLHLPKAEFPLVLRHVERLLKPGGLFFLGVYGGYDHEGIFENDFYTPRRFFSFFTDERIREEAAKVFDVLSFHIVDHSPGSSLHFQALVLRKR